MSFGAGRVDAADQRFFDAFVSGTLHPRDFRHREHLRLAYLCLIAEPFDAALVSFRQLLRDFLDRHHVDPAKYHETLTHAWLQAVHLHLNRSPEAASFADFIDRHAALLDSNLMFTHYTRERLISTSARERFIEPDLLPIHPTNS